MSANQYQLLTCEGCGKTLGYIYVSAKLGISGTIATRAWNPMNPPSYEIEKIAFCEICFNKRVEEIFKGQERQKRGATS